MVVSGLWLAPNPSLCDPFTRNRTNATWSPGVRGMDVEQHWGTSRQAFNIVEPGIRSIPNQLYYFLIHPQRTPVGTLTEEEYGKGKRHGHR